MPKVFRSRPHPIPNTPVLGDWTTSLWWMLPALQMPISTSCGYHEATVSPCESQKKPCLVKSTLIVPAQLLLKIQTSWCLKLNPIKVTIKTTMKNAHVSIIKSPLNSKLCCSNPGNRCCLQGLSLNSQGQGVAIVLHQDLARALRWIWISPWHISVNVHHVHCTSVNIYIYINT